jgi:flagellar basal body rod protein FlgF
MGIAEGLAHKIQELEKVQIEKDATASETASKLSNEVLFAHEEITRLQSEMESMAEEKDGQIEELTTRLLELGQGTTPSTIQQLRQENAHLSMVNKQLEASNLSHQEACTRLQSEEQDLRWKLEAMKANMELQLKVRDERILELESKRG